MRLLDARMVLSEWRVVNWRQSNLRHGMHGRVLTPSSRFSSKLPCPFYAQFNKHHAAPRCVLFRGLTQNMPTNTRRPFSQAIGKLKYFLPAPKAIRPLAIGDATRRTIADIQRRLAANNGAAAAVVMFRAMFSMLYH